MGIPKMAFHVETRRVEPIPCIEPFAGGMMPHIKLHVKVTPNARKSEVIGWEDDPIRGRILRVRIAAPPVEGKANAALRAFLADWLDLPKSKITLEKGDTSRVKTFSIPDDHPLSP